MIKQCFPISNDLEATALWDALCQAEAQAARGSERQRVISGLVETARQSGYVPPDPSMPSKWIDVLGAECLEAQLSESELAWLKGRDRSQLMRLVKLSYGAGNPSMFQLARSELARRGYAYPAGPRGFDGVMLTDKRGG